MRLYAFLAAAVLPLSTFAAPNPSPLEASFVQKREPGIPKREPIPLFNIPATPVKRSSPDKVLLAPRQNSTPSGLGDILGNILPALRAIGSLLNAETIENIKTTIDGLAVVLGNGRAENTGNLLDQVGGLLNQELIDQLKGLLPSLTDLLSEDSIKKIGNLLNNANNLLTEQFVSQAVGLINDVAPLVSAISQIITTLIQAILGG